MRFNRTKISLIAAAILMPQQVLSQGIALEEIVVTAQKRSEGLQSTPIAVTAFTAGALETKGIQDISQVANFTPNLVFDTTSPISGLSSGAVIFIRGIGNTDFSLTTDPGVGMYVDNVYMSRSAGGVMDVLDVERIEVLRGPQGTLFGRNTIGGALNITSRKPSEEFEGSVQVSAGNFDRRDVKASIDIPLTEKLRSNFAISSKNRDGFVDRVLVGDTLGDEDKLSFRANVVYELSEAWDFQLSYDDTSINEQSAATRAIAFTPGGSVVGFGAFSGEADPVGFLNQFITGDDTTFATGLTGTDLDVSGGAFTANYHGNSWDLRYTFSDRETSGNFTRDSDNTPVVITENTIAEYLHEQTTHELQLTGSLLGDKLKYVVGAYLFDEDGTDNSFIGINAPDGGQILINNFAGVDNSSEAFYAQLDYQATEKLEFTLGVRRTEDEKTYIYTQYVSARDRSPLPVPISAVREDGVLTPGFIPIVGNGSGSDTATFEETTVKFGANYILEDDTLLYYSYSEGFKGGGFVLRYITPSPEGAIPFNPEFLSTHEFGFKWQGWEDRVRLNAAIFSSDYDDVQVTLFEIGGGPITANAGVIDIKGVELELTALLTDNLSLELGYGYIDAKYDSINPPAGLSDEFELSNKLVNTPDNSLNFGLQYNLPLVRGDEIAFRFDYLYTDDIFNDSQNSPFLFQEATNVTNISASYTSANEDWTLRLFVDNVGDERFITSGDSNFGLGMHEANFNRPREYGATVSYRF